MGAKFLGESASKGTVEAGKEADLLILDANPLDDIRNTRRIRSVIRGGNVFSHAELVGESKR
jgi:imidazolonepropionase-like amidohydrolase